MHPLDTRVALLEDNHHDLSVRLDETAKALHERIDQQQKMLEGLRSEMATGFSHIQITLTETTKDAMNSMPMWAADRLQEAARKADRDSAAKGMMLGALASMGALVVMLIIAIVNHVPV